MWSVRKKFQIEILEVKTIISRVKNTLDGIKGRFNSAEEKISKLEVNAKVSICFWLLIMFLFYKIKNKNTKCL